MAAHPATALWFSRHVPMATPACDCQGMARGRPREVKLAIFGELLREEIERSPRVKSRSDFARKAEIDTSQLYRYETGKVSPTIDQVRRFAEVLGCEPHALTPPSRVEVEVPYPALAEYMRTPEWEHSPQWQRDQLMRYRAKGGAPTIDTYRLLHTAMKLGATPEEAAAEAEATEAAEAELASTGGRKITRGKR